MIYVIYKHIYTRSRVEALPCYRDNIGIINININII